MPASSRKILDSVFIAAYIAAIIWLWCYGLAEVILSRFPAIFFLILSFSLLVEPVLLIIFLRKKTIRAKKMLMLAGMLTCVAPINAFFLDGIDSSSFFFVVVPVALVLVFSGKHLR